LLKDLANACQIAGKASVRNKRSKRASDAALNFQAPRQSPVCRSLLLSLVFKPWSSLLLFELEHRNLLLILNSEAIQGEPLLTKLTASKGDQILTGIGRCEAQLFILPGSPAAE
jgi:hypothetical protein